MICEHLSLRCIQTSKVAYWLLVVPCRLTTLLPYPRVYAPIRVQTFVLTRVCVQALVRILDQRERM